ncbi:uncharacterized protein LOC143024049 [Oratosquilla oratoria]|uniref:uncharacterized protein LOC143024049 n=1 Tax=Oratosquilla oratoria TaxID=337810 RepID=UPI003F760FF1
MGRINFRENRPNAGPGKRSVIWKLLTKHEISIQKLHTNGAQHTAIADDRTIEELTKKQIKNSFATEGLDIIDPPELNAKRTLIVRQVDEHIHNEDTEAIKMELERNNQYMKITSIIKLPNTRTIIKIKMENSTMVKKSLETGILMFSQSFPPHTLNQETYIHLPQCTRCYAYNHTLKQCTLPATYTICSGCSSKEHRINNSTGNTAQSPHTPTPNPINLKHLTVINTAIIHANITEAATPGTYQQTIDAYYKANGLPTIIIPPSVIKPTAILNMLNNTTHTQSQPEAMETEEQRNKRPLNTEHTPGTEKPTKTKKTDLNTETTIQIITPNTINMTDEEIHQNAHTLLQTNKIKYIYTKEIPEETMDSMITQKLIDLTKTPIQRLTEAKYKKTPQGYFDIRRHKPTDTPHWTVNCQ